MTRFLKPKEASGRLVRLRDTWYSISKRCEGLAEYSSGLDDEFKGALSEIRKEIGECIDLIEQLRPSLEHIVSDKKDEIERFATDARSSLDEFAKRVDAGIQDADALKRINKQISDLTARLERSEKEFREAEARTTEACSKYFERKRDYALAKERVVNAARGKIEGVKGKFMQKLSPILEGYELLLDGRATSVEELFDALYGKSADVEKIALRSLGPSRGFLDMLVGKKEADKGAKETVLRFNAQEVISEVDPIMAEQAQEISTLDVQYSNLKALEIECKNAERRREALSKPREEILNEIAQLRKKNALALAGRNAVLELRGQYLSAFNDADAPVKALLGSVAELLEGYAALEPDREKRELRKRVKELRESVDELKKAKHELEAALGEEAEKNKRAQELLRKYRERLKDSYAQIKRMIEQLEPMLKGE